MTPTPPDPFVFTSLLSGHLQPFYAGLAVHLTRQGLPARLVLPDWHAARRAVESGTARQGEVDGAFQCGLILQQHPHFEAVVAPVPLGRDTPTYSTRVVVRHAFPALQFRDLGTARWTYNDPTSLSGFTALHAHAARLQLAPGFFGPDRWSGSHLASLSAVLDGTVDAAAIDSTVLDAALRARPALRAQLRVIDSIGPYPAPPLALRRGLNPEARAVLVRTLLDLHTGPHGRTLLRQAGFARFAAVEDHTYRPIRQEAALARSWSASAPVPPSPLRETYA